MNDDSNRKRSARRVGRRTVLRGLAGGATALSLGTSVTTAAAKQSGTDGEGEEFTRSPVTIESFDGTKLVGDIYEPTSDGPHPAMLMTHGWGADHEAAYVVRVAKLYARNDYVVLTYDSRGFGESGGEVGVDGPKEVEDAQTLITWLAGRDSVQTAPNDPDNPCIGMDGLSYAGGIQLNTAAKEDRLDAIVPRWAWNDLVYSLQPNRVVKAGWGALLYAVGNTGSRGLTSGDNQPDEHDLRYGLDSEVHEAFLGATLTNEFPEDVKAYYRVRSPVTKLDELGNTDTPTLFIHGWNDTLFFPNEAIWNYEALLERDVETRMLLFEGGHTFEETPDEKTQEFIDSKALEWIETHVRRGGGRSSLPPITYYEVQEQDDTIEQRFDTAEQFPEADDLTLGLADAANVSGDSSVVLNPVAPTSNSQIIVQNNDDRVPVTYADFDFPVEEAFEVFGAPQLTIQVEPFGPQTKLFVKIYHVDADGSESLINNQVTPFTVERPDEGSAIQTVDLEMVAFNWAFEKGDTLRFTVAATDAAFYGSRQSVGARIHHDEEAPSTLSLPFLSSATGRRSPRK